MNITLANPRKNIYTEIGLFLIKPPWLLCLQELYLFIFKSTIFAFHYAVFRFVPLRFLSFVFVSFRFNCVSFRFNCISFRWVAFSIFVSYFCTTNMSSDYESVLCVKNEVFVFKIPPRPSNRGYRFEFITVISTFSHSSHYYSRNIQVMGGFRTNLSLGTGNNYWHCSSMPQIPLPLYIIIWFSTSKKSLVSRIELEM